MIMRTTFEGFTPRSNLEYHGILADEGGSKMRRYQRPGFAAVAGAFGLGLLLALTCSLRLALILAAIMILLLCRCILR